MPATESLSVVVPVYANEATVERLHDELLRERASHAAHLELVFVVDASPDDSLARLLALRDRSSAVRIVALERNAGQSWALLVGLRHATGTWIAMMDADLQDPPSALPSLLAAMDDDTDVVFGGRRGTYQSKSRHFTSRLFKRILGRITRGRVPDDAGLFLVMRRPVAEYLLACGDRDPYILSMLGRGRWRMKSVPVTRGVRAHGGSAYTLRGRMAVAARGFRGLVPPAGNAPTILSRVESDPALRRVLYERNGLSK
jgi:glycosyltransferase involved in cell wall biosynthesis